MTLCSRAFYQHSLGVYLPEGGNRYLIWHSNLRGTEYELRRGMFGKAVWKCFVAAAPPSIAQRSCKLLADYGVRRARHNLLRDRSVAIEVAR